MFYVYLLQSKGHTYVGSTSDLKRRFKEHNSGQNLSTKRYMPWELIFYEAYINKNDATRREHYLKTTQGRRALKKMLSCYYKESQTISSDYQGATTG